MNNNEENTVIGPNVLTCVALKDGKVRTEQKGGIDTDELDNDDNVVTTGCGSVSSNVIPPEIVGQIIKNQKNRPPRQCDIEEPNKGFDAQSTQMGLPLVGAEEYDK